MDTASAAVGEETTIVPRPVVVLIVIALTIYLGADLGFQFVPGSTHEASPVIDGALIALIGAIVTGARGPKPGPEPPEPPAAPADTGRHRPPGETP